MRKTITALAMALLIVAMAPFAAAEEMRQPRMQADTANGSPEPMLIAAGNGSGNGTGDGPRPVLISAEINESRIRLRQITRERLQLAQQNFEQARHRYQNAKQRFGQARQRLNDERPRYRECAGDQSEECQQVRRETKQNAKQYLLGSADRVISMMEQIKERVRSCEQMSEEEAQERIAAIDAKIAEIQASRGTIEGLNNESDPAEIRNAVNEIKQSWTGSRQEMKRSAGRLINAKIGGVVVKSQKLQERLENAIANLEEAGEDTTELESLMDEFNAKLESANEHYKAAREQYRKSGSEAEISSAMQEANRQMQQSRNELKEAHSVLSQIMRQIRAAQGGDEALEEAEAEDEE